MAWVNFAQCLCQRCKRRPTCRLRHYVTNAQSELINKTKLYDKNKYEIDFKVSKCHDFVDGEETNLCGV